MKKPFHQNQSRLIDVTRQARATGDGWLAADQIVQRMHIPPASLKGVLGGFGLRARYIHGWPKWQRPFRFLFERERRDGVDHYRITQPFCDALDAVVVAAVERANREQ